MTFTAKHRDVCRWRTLKTSAKAPPPNKSINSRSLQKEGNEGNALGHSADTDFSTEVLEVLVVLEIGSAGIACSECITGAEGFTGGGAPKDRRLETVLTLPAVGTGGIWTTGGCTAALQP
mmetsp:Transcript_45195/g.98298  ORF Transcript_45195/g.98298 Transcript_45195/m.98298 type:complete len:120 (+) Transcript_45195:448-807(+)